MVKSAAYKTAVCATAFMLSFGFSTTAKAETYVAETGLAGISTVLETYYQATTEKDGGAAEAYMETLSEDTETTNSEGITKVVSPYANLGISIAGDYVNIRKEANTDSEVVGKLYEGCAADILDRSGDWVKIHSGNVDGYINAEFLAIGTDAEALIDKYATKYATVVNTKTLRVRDKKSTDATTITLIPLGETYYVINEYDKWVEIQIDDGDGEEGGVTGFVSKDYISIDVKFKYAISIEEEKAKLAAEEAAKQAEIDRLEQLASDQEAQRKNEQDKKAAAEKAAEASEEARDDVPSQSSSSGNSSSGQSIANYALNFVGNPYVWGGESLTNGADCSGFVKSIYSHFGYGISRTSREQSSNAGQEVSIGNLQAGDLIFYTNSSGSVNHVALYIGNGKVVHASNRREGIKVSSYNYRTPYKARRVTK